MKTPAIIPAYNEAAYIAQTLERLPRDEVEPIVAANACTDDTVEIARSFGCEVLDLPSPGKLPAIQTALRALGNRALEPLLLLDGDAYPHFPRAWHHVMVASVQTRGASVPEVTGGPSWLTEAAFGLRMLKTADRLARAAIVGSNGTAETFMGSDLRRRASQLGPNMALRLASPQALERVVEMPHYWPHEDKAIANVVLESGGPLHQLMDPRAIVVKPVSDSLPDLRTILSIGPRAAYRQMQAHYIGRGALGSIPFTKDVRDRGM